MKKLFLTLNAVVCILHCTAQTNVSGFISANTAWTLAGSPYIIVGNALLSSGYTLTIDPGVVVKFDAAKALQIDGELIAIGTPANRITFTSNQSVSSPGYWAKIHFSDQSLNAAYDINGNYMSGCIMKYCDILYGGSSGNGQIHVVNSSPYFSNCNIKYSNADGIYCSGSSCKIDSSTIANCTGVGLSFYSIQATSCGLSIRGDSILNNQNGGIYTNYPPGCTTIISDNYFYGNTYASSISIGGQNIHISNNSFVNNTAYGAIVSVQGDGNIISSNYFMNNSSTVSGGRILHCDGPGDTVRCNLFMGNQTGPSSQGVLYMHGSGSAADKNIFDSNFNNSPYSVVVSDFHGSTGTNTVAFTNNIIRNNNSPTGICCKFSPELYGNPMMIIKNNEFLNNTVGNAVYITMTGTTTNNFLEFSHNNFSDPGTLYELYNNAPYGSEDIYCDSNYWGGTSTQHLDSVIYDYFDDATKSVVYYAPLLSSPVTVDSSCNSVVTSSLDIAPETSSTFYPNPFSDVATIRFEKEVHGATFILYNSIGERVTEITGINGENFQFNQENLENGIYIFEVMEKEKRIALGKALKY